MKRIASALIVVAGVLQGCGGGGGGDSSNTGTPPQVTSYALSASVAGLEGSLTLVANAEAPVTISASTQTTLARLPSGTAYTVSISAQPSLQHCTLGASSGTLTADATINITCTSRITAQKSTVSGFEIARFDAAGLDLQNDEYSGSIDGSIGVTLAAVDGGLVLLMPPLTDGAHRLEVLIDDVRYPIDFNISTPALPLPATQIATDFVADIETGLAALRSDPALAAMSDWTAIDAEVAALKAQISTMSAADLDALARIIAMNNPTSAAAVFAKADRSPLMLKYNDAACLDIHRRVTSHLIDSVAYLSWVAAATAVGVDLGPYGAVVGVTAAGSLYVFKAWPAMKALWSTLKEYRTEQCFFFQRLNFDLKLEERFLREKPGRTALSMAMTQEILKFNHKRTREYDVTGSGTLPEDIRESASLASKILKFTSAFLSDDTQQLLQGWTASYTHPIDLSDFTLSDVTHPSIKGTMSVQAGMLRLRFEYLPDQMPAAPADFTFTLSGNNQSWQIPAQLNLIDPPIALDDDVSTPTNEMFQGELKANFAESFRISLQPINGVVTLDAASGVYQYTPNTDFTGDDSFQFVAANDRGESAPATVRIAIAGLCELVEAGDYIDRTCYTDMERTTIDFVEHLNSAPGSLQVEHAKLVHLIPGDSTSSYDAESYRYIVLDNLTTVELIKSDWIMMPGTTNVTTQTEERVSFDHVSGATTRLAWYKWSKNLASMTGARESLHCADGKYTWLLFATSIDPITGAQYDDSPTRTDYDVPGPCPKTGEDAASFLPALPLEDIRVWQIWNARR